MIPRLDPDGVARFGRKENKRHHRKPNAERVKTEPWRKSGYGSEYKVRRIAAIEKTGGRCAKCGRTVAVLTADGWRMRGGEVHHVRPLAQGGCDGRLILLCKSCHGLLDAELRRQRRRV